MVQQRLTNTVKLQGLGRAILVCVAVAVIAFAGVRALVMRLGQCWRSLARSRAAMLSCLHAAGIIR